MRPALKAWIWGARQRWFRRWNDFAADAEFVREQRRAFEEEVEAWWSEALDPLDVLWLRTIQESRTHDRRVRPGAVADGDETFLALRELHARACRVTSEIVALLRTGHPDGATSRWRTLHEVAVTMSFLGRHGDAIATAYRLHPASDQARIASQRDRHAQDWGLEPTEPDEMAAFESDRDALAARFGPGFNREWGWARSAFPNLGPNGRVTFAMIEESMGLSHHRPLFQMASQTIHAGPRGLLNGLALFDDGTESLIVGPRNEAFDGPAVATTRSFMLATKTFLDHRQDTRSRFALALLEGLADVVESSWVEAAERLGDAAFPASPPNNKADTGESG